MSKFLSEKDGKYIFELESMEECKWLVNDVCCNDRCDCVADFPYPRSICELDEDGKNYGCAWFEKEDGKIKK